MLSSALSVSWQGVRNVIDSSVSWRGVRSVIDSSVSWRGVRSVIVSSVSWRGVRSVIVRSVCAMARCKKCFVAALDWLAKCGSAEYHNSANVVSCHRVYRCQSAEPLQPIRTSQSVAREKPEERASR